MKKVILFSVTILAVISLLGVTPFTVAAKAGEITVCSLQTDGDKIPGKIWYTDNNTILHMRGQTTYSTLTPLAGHSECDPVYSSGSLVIKVNFDLNLSTGEGVTWGYSVQTPPGSTGTFVGPFHGSLKGFVMEGKSITLGTGAYEGLILKVTIQQVSENQYEAHGYVIGH